MPPLLQSAIGSVLRAILIGWAGYFVSKGYWTEAEATTYASALVLFLLGFGWSLWQKYRAHLTILAALETPAGTSFERLQEIQKLG
jgi:uncharacterized membrane protein YjjB (DUF3815 family)